MKRLAILTVGKTHSGKTTFAKALEKRMPNSVVIDQDNHAEILHTYYPSLLPKKGPNNIKYALTQTIVDYAVNDTSCHIILCNSNRNYNIRQNLLGYYHGKDFTSVVVYFDIPNHVLEERIQKSQRNTTILRTVSSFEEVFIHQNKESQENGRMAPTKEEADHLFVIRTDKDVEDVISKISEMLQMS
ncbi:AAA family ATPase [Planococcus sp. N028]|uniref:AAA family ATPase n=1 Tax=Planococcus shixiaomingii TaxID=3058393 RepID=A0ABT8MZ35_9BACL|nr:AAA family ATPase [Planococcus sp. N028]MDN7240891.1 AAA family ATPase [Planococcus sp. N028]